MRPNIGVMRSRVAARLTETGTVTRPGEGDGVFDPETGEYTFPPPTVVHDGPLLVRPQNRGERVVEAGGATYALTRYDVTLPAGVDVRRADTVTVTAAPYDDALVGVSLTVLDVPLDAWQVARVCVAQRTT